MTKLRSLLILVISTIPFSLFASDTGYEVELIIFEDARARYQHSEDWSFNDTRNKVLLEQPQNQQKKGITDKEYKQLEWSEASLAKNLERLDRNPNFRILVTKRWKQTGLSRDETFDIDIDSQQDGYVSAKAEAEGDSAADETMSDSATPSYITGKVKLIMSRYLHFNVDLEYFRPAMDENSESVYRKFPVISERRMRSKETHYIDHPLVGVIVLATPYKIEDPENAKTVQEYRTL